ncbi:type II toxin-antitoxin system VapB family antitoxin [Aquibium microcysteis]|uniref:type II toxin-antitoxin system VapB family antitoxin n=1 Tax=Aquibium microcysteis TaxID=675281 RepID=UPI00165D1918|nr:type II toxin-antitoxin system VapB family antitoxin [Aquibium microcysteis]
MGIHIQDEETARVVREFAARRGLDVTAAIRAAIAEAEAATAPAASNIAARIEPILAEIRARRSKEPFDEKAFMDEMWGQDD